MRVLRNSFLYSVLLAPTLLAAARDFTVQHESSFVPVGDGDGNDLVFGMQSSESRRYGLPASSNGEGLHLNDISLTNNFVTLSNPHFPNHSVRIKKTDFCDHTVKCVHHS